LLLYSLVVLTVSSKSKLFGAELAWHAVSACAHERARLQDHSPTAKRSTMTSFNWLRQRSRPTCQTHRQVSVGHKNVSALRIGMLVHPAALQTHAENASGSWLRQAAKCAGIRGLNPKVFLLFLALLPQFTNRNASWPVAVQILVLGLVHIASCAAIYTGSAPTPGQCCGHDLRQPVR